MDYVILRVPGLKKRTSLGGLPAATAAEAVPVDDVTLEKTTLSAKDVLDAQRDPEVLGHAPRMPVRLVSPVDAQAAAGPAAVAADAGSVTWGLEAMGVPASPFTGSGVIVAVLDTGIQATHPAFQGREIIQMDFTGEGDGDRHGHGTHCAGTIFGGDVNGVRIGVARGIKRAMIGKVLGTSGGGGTDKILDGILWALRSGANVISMSLGFDFPGMVADLEARGLPTEPATSQALSAYRDNVRLFESVAGLVRAHAGLFSKAIIVGAAGNESMRPKYEIMTAPPAAAEGILSVGAVARGSGAPPSYAVAYFSNATPDVAAPGVDVRSAGIAGGLKSMNGTSMATPHVAGVAALWLEWLQSSNPGGWKISELEARLVGLASHDGIAAGADRVNTGAGLVRAPRATD